MSNKLNCILLVDDDEFDIRLHSYAIKRLNISNEINVVNNGEEALEYLLNPSDLNSDGQFPHPELIFIDLNMPCMNGVEFIQNMKIEE